MQQPSGRYHLTLTHIVAEDWCQNTDQAIKILSIPCTGTKPYMGAIKTGPCHHPP